MSDHDAPDPVDRAYARAEALLDDEAARAARRARVLGAVVDDAATPVGPPQRRVSWATGAWLTAASVAGVSLLVALQLSTPPVRPKAPSPEPVEAPVAAAPAPVTPPAASTTDEAAPPAHPTQRAAPVLSPADVAPAPLVLPPAPAADRTAAPPAAAPPPPAPPMYEDGVDALVVQGQRREESLQPLPRSAPLDSATAQKAVPPHAQAAKLHAAATAGRLAELNTLLAQGTPVDAPDADGETALMKAVESRNAAAAALLRRHGASLDRTNDAGVSAGDMAAAIDDPDINRALGLEP